MRAGSEAAMDARGEEPNWSEAVEDLVEAGDVDGAISVLESVIAGLRNADGSSAPPHGGADASLRLAAALVDLADLHASRGRSLLADKLHTQALLLRGGADRASGGPSPSSPFSGSRGDSEQANESIISEREDSRGSAAALDNGSGSDSDDDWEAIADVSLPDIAGLSSSQPEEKTQVETTPRRRGRGTFLYNKDGLYSDQLDVGRVASHSDSEEEPDRQGSGETLDSNISRFGTRHVLVLYDFPPSTRTTELEKLFEGFRDDGFVIRWVHDTCALAVFRTPSIADQARNSIQCPFKVRTIDESDKLLSQISKRDLEPPIPRPKTSARTAQRMISQVMGLKVRTDFSSRELRIQESARKDRIHARQVMKDDAWGPDDP